jgi:hypothetical protein
MKAYKRNAIIIGALFIFTMLAGMVDAYYVAPMVNRPVSSILHIDNQLLTGAFSIIVMAVGIVFIALTFFPVVKKYSESIALTYVALRTIECLLLIVGAMCYFYIITLSNGSESSKDIAGYAASIAIALKLKYYGFQIAMMILGFGSLFLCYALYRSKFVPPFLSVWGGIGYLLLMLSAIFEICGVMDTTKGLGAIMYIPGGLWELVVFPGWLFIKGFKVDVA